ncbi:hypothetical protein PHYSODRAFT_338313 [Phytophthora sojae]|uniref:Uncharacterized protein n=1 Tax=Phytophthora sojae (strain P6497) TaxID=1094619 RepID=G5A4D5_PHYSP|nr:hypothetical protein PHYSODRAFT_338313 [Phytophthora sojae]EGZ09536.1 hypothetical protein PHYSODRAFT_338313 [Phytophthora sojae]|eukprot:XP_009534397.1 hypothetical protein PHYSODRAFT_338313 [Phytophthora sojae]
MGSKLRQLTPVMHLPAVVSARQEALQGLKKISAIQVSHAAEKDRYVVDVCAEDRPNSTSTPQDGDKPRARSRRVEKDLSEFVDLHDKVYDIVHFAHRRDQSELCSKILDVIVFGPNPDSLVLHFVSRKRVARELGRFLEALRKVTVEHTTTGSQGGCSGQTLVVQVVHGFLL